MKAISLACDSLLNRIRDTPAFGRTVSGISKYPDGPSDRGIFSNSRDDRHLVFSYLSPPCFENFEMDKISETVDLGSGSQDVTAAG